MIGPADPETPLILSVPHAGRDYPPSLCAALGVPLAALRPLEDRHVDAVAMAARLEESMIIARRPRAWIDLNRSEDERDPSIEEAGVAQRLPHRSPRVRSGLGLVPRRAGGSGPIWRRRWLTAEIEARIEQDHRPYHRAVATLLARARQRFGIAVLIDLHSMPPLTPAGSAPQLVIGDRFGRSAAPRLVARIEDAARSLGLRAAMNAPYAGGHLLERHAAPASGIHAIQIELDRSLYLDEGLDQPGPGLSRTAAALRDMLDAVLDDVMPQRLAAE
jgi:N-formylglutamate amidohydrolase